MTPRVDASGEEAAPPAIICAGVVHLYPGRETTSTRAGRAGGDGPVVALRNVDLEVRASEMVAIVGPSGSGKSTLLSLLGGLLRPTAGRVLVAGHDMGRLDGRSLDRLRATELSILLQEPLRNLLPYATAEQNLTFAQRGARRRGWPLRWGVGAVIDVFGLSSVARTPIHELAGGVQQKVAIATAMSTSPNVLLADEPTNQLDSTDRDAVVETLKHVHDVSGATVVVVTHDTALASALPRSVTITEGAISSEGRRGRSFSVVARDGSIRLPAEVVSLYPPGTLFRVTVGDRTVELRPETEADP